MFDRYFHGLNAWFDWSQSIMQIWWGPGARPGVRPARPEDAPDLAALHAKSFAHPWSALSFEQMLTDRAIVAHVAAAEGERPVGFILSRKAAEEAEILTVAVAESARRGGLGRRLIEANCDVLVRERIRSLFLEVESGNTAGLALYARLGFFKVGMRKGYYRSAAGAQDALTMRLDLNRRVPSLPPLDG